MRKGTTKRRPYRYLIGSETVATWRKLYKVDSVPCHKRGGIFVPVSMRMQHRIAMAELGNKGGSTA